MGDKGDVFAIIVLVFIIAILVGGWFAFPAVTHFMQQQDCVAVGRTNC
jgi:hypothetical protein